MWSLCVPTRSEVTTVVCARISSENKTAVSKNRTANVQCCELCVVCCPVCTVCTEHFYLNVLCAIRCAVKAPIDFTRIKIFPSLYILFSELNLHFACFSTYQRSRVTSEATDFCSQLIGFRSIRVFPRQYFVNTIRLWIFKQNERCAWRAQDVWSSNDPNLIRVDAKLRRHANQCANELIMR